MPIDINELRDYKGGDPAIWRKYMEQRFKDPTIVDQVLAMDKEWREMRASIDDLRKEKNRLQKDVIGPKKKAKEPCDEEVAQMKAIQDTIKEKEDRLPELEAARDKLCFRIGNRVDPEVPISKNEDKDNLVVKLFPHPSKAAKKGAAKAQPVGNMGVNQTSKFAVIDLPGITQPDAKPAVSATTTAVLEGGDDGDDEDDGLLPCPLGELEYPLPETKPLTHDDLLWRIGGYEPVRGQNVAGHRSYFLTNAGVWLNQALINYGIAFLGARGYNVVQPPFFMNKEVMATIAQLEDFDEQLYKVSGKTDDPEGGSEKYLIATSEQPLCAYHKGDWIDPKELPLRYVGISTCFRKEAGSSGRDIRGIFRVHQFEKIEQFCLTADDFEVSQAEQKRMLQCATDFYESLGIGYRVVCIVSGELNDAAVKKYDLEGWFPGQKAYRELVSCSNCTDYQARGVGVRCGMKSAAKSDLMARASYVHMLNSTLCATGRGICCILETHQTPTGIVVPEVLRPFMGGRDFLPFVRGPPEASKGEKGKGDKGGKGDNKGGKGDNKGGKGEKKK